jgi:uncharacterized protein YcnI
MKLASLVATLAVGGLILAGAGGAHIQVLPATAAPGDPTLFTVLVPNEADNPTAQIDLKIPDGVIPFSFEETPGWTRSEQLTENGALDVVTWQGSLPAGEFVRFWFLARTPDQPGEIAWPAVQRYSDGTVVRWIGAPGSEEPAAVTVISADATRQNAGGEGEEPASTPTDTAATQPGEAAESGAEEPAAGPQSTEPEESTAAAAAPTSDGGGRDGLTLVIAIAALVLALLALLGIGVRRRRKA